MGLISSLIFSTRGRLGFGPFFGAVFTTGVGDNLSFTPVVKNAPKNWPKPTLQQMAKKSNSMFITPWCYMQGFTVIIFCKFNLKKMFLI